MGVSPAKILIRVLLVVSAFSFTRISFADFKDGLEAFDGGDLALAVEEWQLAVGEGNLDAAVSLADLYLTGIGVPADPKEAVRLYRLAAEQGHGVAQLNLGDLYARGLGVERNLIEAHLWLTRAADQGRRWAARRRQEVEDSMTPQERADAQKRLAD